MSRPMYICRSILWSRQTLDQPHSLLPMTSRIFDPLRLPYEVWVRCIQFYACDQPGGPLPLITVSLSWQKELLEAPEIWTTLYFDGGHDEESRAECFFCLSKTELVDVILDRNSIAMDIAIKYGDQIKSLVFKTKYEKEYSSADISRFAYKLSSGAYPNLARVDVEPPCYLDDLIPSTLLRVCPSLVRIQGAYVDSTTLPSVSSSTTKLAILGTGMIPNGICDSLEVLRIRCVPAYSKDPITCRYFNAPTTILKVFELEFGVETRALITGQANPFTSGAQYILPLVSFTAQLHPNLQVLRVTIPWFDLSRLLPLSLFAALKELRLILDCTIKQTTPWTQSTIPLGETSHIQKLSLACTPRRTSDTGPSYLPVVIQLFTGPEELRFTIWKGFI